MENDLWGRVASLIYTTYKFIRQYYTDCIAGRYFEEYSQKEFPLPVNLQMLLRQCVKYLRDINLAEYPSGWTEMDSRQRFRFLMIHYGSTFDAWGDRMDDLMFIIWIAVSCVSALKFQTIGVIEAPGAVKQLVSCYLTYQASNIYDLMFIICIAVSCVSALKYQATGVTEAPSPVGILE